MHESRSGARARPSWETVPPLVREFVEQRFGPVLRTTSLPSGNTPGVVSALEVADRTVVLKTIAREEPLARAYEAEGAVGALLPSTAPAPAVLAHDVVAEWVVVLFEYVAGRHPDLSPASPDLVPVHRLLCQLGTTLSPCPGSLAAAGEDLRAEFSSWRRLTSADLRGSWAADYHGTLITLEQCVLDAMDGDTLLHTDLGATNMVVSTSGVTVLDWSWAVRGAAWVDVAFLLPQLIMAGHAPAAAEAAMRGVPAWEHASTDAIDGFAAAVTGLWTATAGSGPPSLQEYRVRALRAGRSWVAHRMGWPVG